jgi:hypothetical protein
MEPETYVRVLEARLTAVDRLEQERRGGDPIPDEAFLSARQIYLATGPIARMSAAPLSREEQLLAPELIGFEEALNSACLHLLTVLGFTLLTPAGLPVEGAPSWAPPVGVGR